MTLKETELGLGIAVNQHQNFESFSIAISLARQKPLSILKNNKFIIISI
jgi:hypothetical protein